MRYIKWKNILITCIVCLLPILLGVALWQDLPDTMAIHFNINNEPDNFAPKAFVVFGLPVMMAIMQVICCVANDINAKKHGENKKIEKVTSWILPSVSIVLQIMTLGYGLGFDIDIRRVAVFIVSVIFLMIGNYMPKLNYVKNYNIDSEKARKINRVLGFETVIMGILGIVSIILPPVASVIWLILLIPYAAVGAIYGIKVTRSK